LVDMYQYFGGTWYPHLQDSKVYMESHQRR